LGIYIIAITEKYKEADMAKYTSYMTLGQIMKDPELRDIVLKHIPDVESDPRYSMGRMYSLNDIKYEVDSAMRAKIELIIADLNALG
jgi:hypothetical protein